ncbi:unnamed protein product [Cylicostephanus goldi]|uniref:Uncharacterized protein n=1 Tax=Cylicostephanus goldi TaxID=71465 RepID=A0A3P7MQR4_CYLGO|nr:unnamed protein product [Cylicostephanus goldi]
MVRLFSCLTAARFFPMMCFLKKAPRKSDRALCSLNVLEKPMSKLLARILSSSNSSMGLSLSIMLFTLAKKTSSNYHPTQNLLPRLGQTVDISWSTLLVQ